MSLSFTQHTLDKLESLLKTLGFKLRYEKGNFKTGAADLLQNTETDDSLLDEKQKAFLYLLKQTKIEF
jgi:hypothetical protein